MLPFARAIPYWRGLYPPALQAPRIAVDRRAADHALNARHTATATRIPGMADKTDTPAKKLRSKWFRVAGVIAVNRDLADWRTKAQE